MNLIPVESSNIAALGHMGDKMHVEFKTGARYEYDNVSQELFASILNAESIGSAFSTLIKKQASAYPFRKLT